METKANYSLVGAFVIFFLVAILVFIVWIARLDFSNKVTEYDIYFSKSVTGLKEGGTVLYRGVPVGAVKKIALDADNVETVRVTIFIQGDVPIKEDAFASLELQGITGVAYIQLNGGTSSAKKLRPKKGTSRAVIPTRSSVFEEVTASIPAVLNQASKTLEEIRSVFDKDNKLAFSETLKNLHTISKALVPATGQETNVQELLKGMKDGMKEIHNMVKELNVLLSENRKNISSFTEEGLPALTHFLNEGKETLSTIRHIGEALERSPSRFMSRDSKEGVKVP